MSKLTKFSFLVVVLIGLGIFLIDVLSVHAIETDCVSCQLTVHVNDSSTHEPIEGANVHIEDDKYSHDFVTDSNGKVDTSVPPGDYNITASKSGYCPNSTEKICNWCGNPIHAIILLSKCPEDKCYDGIDNDEDGLIDCEDSDCEGKYCGDCSNYDCRIDDNPFSFDYLISGTMTCKDGMCSSDTCEYGHFCADDDLNDSVTVSCHAECDEDEDCKDYCDGSVRYYDGYCDILQYCTCSYSIEDCDDYDGWYNTTNTRWVSDTCIEKEQKEQEYRDYTCEENEGTECAYIVTDTRWVDTGNTRNKPDGTPCDDGLWCTVDDQCSSGQCIGTERDCSDNNECTQDICNEELDQCENPPKPEGTYCGEPRDCPDSYCEGFFGVFYPVDGHDYCDGEGNCIVYSCDLIGSYCTDDDPCDGIDGLTCGAECDQDEDCEDYCEGDIRYYNGLCDLELTCTCSWLNSEDCNDYDENNCWCEVENNKYLFYKCDDWTCGDGECIDSGSDWDKYSETCGKEFECQHADFCTEYICFKSNVGRWGKWTWDTEPESTELICDDGDDNDCDGLVDCQDPDCDTVPPETTKTYEGSHLIDGEYEWINSMTLINLTAVDNPAEGQCASGVKETKYKVKLVPNEYCENSTLCQPVEDGDWQTYTEPFTINEDSCHIIEFYSIDNLNNQEELKWQCVFVDNKPPVINKTIGEPKTECQGSECDDWNWKITLNTSITLSCEDQEPHPAGKDKLLYRIKLDNGEWSDWIDPDGIKIIYFEEECTHTLEVFCNDTLGNSVTDVEKFKVEGTSFEIQLNKKWNLVSVPFVLLNDDPEEVFKDIKDDIESVWTYDPEDPACASTENWCLYVPGLGGNLAHIKPGWGYWIKMKEPNVLLVGGKLMSPAKTLPSRSLTAGWNLIGYYGTDGRSGYYGPFDDGRYAYCTLYSLVDTHEGYTKWSSLYSYWDGSDFELNECDDMYPGAGYWIGMIEAVSEYMPSTVCPGCPCE